MARILIVDDDIGFRSILAQLMETQGYEALEASDGLDALRLLGPEQPRSSDKEKTPDLFIIDYNMPGMGGYELIRKLREREDTRSIPIIMLTGTTKDLREVVEIEGVQYLEKFCPDRELVATARTMLESLGHAPVAPSCGAPPQTSAEGTSEAPASQEEGSQQRTAPLPEVPKLDDALITDRSLVMGGAGMAAEGEKSQVIQLVEGILADAIQRRA